MKNGEKPLVSPHVVLREEFDDWAVLFNCDTGHGFGLNPIGVLIWKLLDGDHTMEDILFELREKIEGVPADTEEHINEFVTALAEQGLAGCEVQTSKPLEQIPAGGLQTSHLHRTSQVGTPKEDRGILMYEKPELVDFICGVGTAQGVPPCNPFGSQAGNTCGTGNLAVGHGCANGNLPAHTGCSIGTGN